MLQQPFMHILRNFERSDQTFFLNLPESYYYNRLSRFLLPDSDSNLARLEQ